MSDADPNPGPIEPPPDAAAFIAGLDERLLGGDREYTRVETADAAGMDVDDARELWQALGFASVGDDVRAFTDADIEALKLVGEVRSTLSLDDESLRAMTRMLGRTFSRLASWQGQLVIELLGRSPELLSSPQELVERLDHLLETMSNIQTYLWRRQLAAYLARVTTNAGALSDGEESTMAVGFADMAAFTAFTRRSSEEELRGVLEKFESVATDIVGAHHGQIVKMIGDEVLFVADTPKDGAEIALALIAAADGDDVLPELRVGIASGAVVSRLGDVFGQTVNIASRLTSIAKPGSVLVDANLADAIDGDGAYRLSAMRPVSVRGYHHLRPRRLRPAKA